MDPGVSERFGEIDRIMQKKSIILLVLLVLTLTAAIPRFYGLDRLSFYGDEETTSVVSRSFAEGQGNRFPSGMLYRRALPQTWLNALSAQIFGLEREFSYRFPAALLGTLTIPLLFFLARPVVGGPVALIAALLLAFSEWHILLSRTARMYAPFLFFYVSTGFTLWRWAVEGTRYYLFLAAGLFCAAVSFHALGVFSVFFAIIPLLLKGWSRVPTYRPFIFAFAAGFSALVYKKLFLNAPYKIMFASKTAMPGVKASVATAGSSWLARVFEGVPVAAIPCALIGIACGLWAARRSCFEDKTPGAHFRTFAFYLAAMLGGALACTGQVYAAGIVALLLFSAHPDNGISILKKVRYPVIIIFLLMMAWSGATILKLGLYGGLKALLTFPFPFPVPLAKMFPGVFLFFIGMCVYLAFKAFQPGDKTLRASLLVVWLTIGTVGMFGLRGIRYVVEIYPFLLILSAAGLVYLLMAVGQWTKRWGEKAALVMAVLITASGFLVGHGIPQAFGLATLQHGGKIDRVLTFPYPDHQGPGQFVRQNLVPGDIVVAEDMLQQHWYVGRVDFWLRNPKDSYTFLYVAPDGKWRDIYVDSVMATPEILNTIGKSEKRRTWVITSAETFPARNYYLSPEQRRWLSDIEERNSPVFIGRDGVSKVYCLNCSPKVLK